MRIPAVAVVLVAFITSACGGSSSGTPTQPNTPTPPAQTNRAPSITSMSMTPFGIQSLSQFVFTGSATDLDGDSLTYSWDIGGNPFTGTSGNLLINVGGAFIATLTVTDGRGGSATDSRTFVVGSMAGTWVVTSGFLQGATFNLTHSSTGQVTGSFLLPGIGSGNTDPAQPGRIDANGNLTMRVKVAPFTDFNMTGVMTQTGRTVSGSLQGSGFSGDPFSMSK